MCSCEVRFHRINSSRLSTREQRRLLRIATGYVYASPPSLRPSIHVSIILTLSASRTWLSSFLGGWQREKYTQAGIAPAGCAMLTSELRMTQHLQGESDLAVHLEPPLQPRERLVVVSLQKADFRQASIHLLQETCGFLEMSILLRGLCHSRGRLDTSDMNEFWLC
jgi:hypothetical protein